MTQRHKTLLYNCLPYLFIVVMVGIIMIPQITNHAFISGIDSYFHMNQIYEDAMQIKHGTFSYFMGLYGFQRTGRIVNAVYAPLTSYFLGLLLLITGSWYHFEILWDIITLLIGGIGTYLLTRVLEIKRAYGTFLTLIYILSYPSLKWLGNQETNDLGALLLPWTFIVASLIVKHKDIHVLPLTLLMTALIQIHFLTAFGSIMVLCIATIVTLLCHGTDRKHFLWQGCKATGLTVLLNLNIIGGLLELFNQDIVPTFPEPHTQQNSLQIHWFSIASFDKIVSFIIIITILFFIIRILRDNRIEIFLLICSVWFLSMITVYFPWHHLEVMIPKVQNTIQFSARFVPYFLIASLSLVGLLLNNFADHECFIPKSIRYTGGLAVILLMSVLLIHSAYGYLQYLPRTYYRPSVVRYLNSTYYQQKDSNKVRAGFHSPNLRLGVTQVTKIIYDYIPTNQSIKDNDYYRLPLESKYRHQLQHPKLMVHRHAFHNGMTLTWKSKHRKKTVLPDVVYKHSKVTLNGKPVHPKKTLVGAMKVHEKQGINHLTIIYHPHISFYLLIIVMILSWLSLIGWLIYNKCRNNKNND